MPKTLSLDAPKGAPKPRLARSEPSYAPRLMRRLDAARYVGVSPTKFDEWVRQGQMPPSRKFGGVVVWDRLRLDAAVDELFDDMPQDISL